MRETYMSEPFEFSFPTCTLDVIQNEAFNVSISGTLGDIKSRVDFRVSPCPEGITWEKVFPEHLPPSIRFLGLPSTIGTSTVHVVATTSDVLESIFLIFYCFLILVVSYSLQRNALVVSYPLQRNAMILCRQLLPPVEHIDLLSSVTPSSETH